MNVNEKLFDFIKSSPSCFHAIANVAEKLEKAGAKRLVESQKWEIKRGETCFVTRNGSSLIAVRIPEEIDGGFMVTASHSDSPTFKIKDKPELEGGNYVRINTERYGGMIFDSWFDRPLSVAGRILVRTENGIKSNLVSTEPLLLIPACFLGGGAFCLMCDLIARTAFAPTEVSISSITAIFGAPIVIYMMVRRKAG